MTLRGQLDDREAIAKLEVAVRRVDGVSDVVNLLHQAGEPPPNKAAVLRAQQSQAGEAQRRGATKR